MYIRDRLRVINLIKRMNFNVFLLNKCIGIETVGVFNKYIFEEASKKAMTLNPYVEILGNT